MMIDSTAVAKVLVIDDQELMREFLKTLLQMAGYEVMTVAEGASGLALLRQWKPDVAILDRMMPGMTGDEVLEQVRKNPETRDVQVIFLTAKAGHEDEIESPERQPDAYLTKPFENQELLLIVERCLARVRQTPNAGFERTWTV
jgi:CheY-like chemotaxis protein